MHVRKVTLTRKFTITITVGFPWPERAKPLYPWPLCRWCGLAIRRLQPRLGPPRWLHHESGTHMCHFGRPLDSPHTYAEPQMRPTPYTGA